MSGKSKHPKTNWNRLLKDFGDIVEEIRNDSLDPHEEKTGGYIKVFRHYF